jgi:hypothetical protein
LGNRYLGRPFRLVTRRGYWYGHDIRGLVKTIKDAIFTDHRRGAYMNVGRVLAGGGGLSCKLQAGVGALDLIGEGESAFINRTFFVSWIISHDYTHHLLLYHYQGSFTRP